MAGRDKRTQQLRARIHLEVWASVNLAKRARRTARPVQVKMGKVGRSRPSLYH